MRQGMDRGGKPQDRRGTSRTNKPTTGRMAAAGGGGSRSDTQRQQVAPAQQDGSKNTMYMAIGGGALVLVLIMAFMLSGGESGGHSGGSGESIKIKAINRSDEAFMRGEYRAALDIAEEALRDPKTARSSRRKALEASAARARAQVNLDRDAAVKVAEFKSRVDAAVKDQTAMAKAKGFWDECNVLMGSYATTTSGKILKDIKEDLRRWVATESQGDWQKDYNVTKARIEKSYLADGKYSEAIREWRKFGEVAQDPLLHSRIDSEISSINLKAVSAAEKVVAEAAGDRSKLEEAQQRFNGTEGLAVINKAMKSIK